MNLKTAIKIWDAINTETAICEVDSRLVTNPTPATAILRFLDIPSGIDMNYDGQLRASDAQKIADFLREMAAALDPRDIEKELLF